MKKYFWKRWRNIADWTPTEGNMQAVLVQAATIPNVVLQILIKLQLHLGCRGAIHTTLIWWTNMFWNIIFLGKKDLFAFKGNLSPLHLQRHAKIITVVLFRRFVVYYIVSFYPLMRRAVSRKIQLYLFASKERANWKHFYSSCKKNFTHVTSYILQLGKWGAGGVN